MSERLFPLEQSAAQQQEVIEQERDIELLGKLLTNLFPITDEEIENQHTDLVTPDGREFLVKSSLTPAHYLPKTHAGARSYGYIIEPKRLAKHGTLAVSLDGDIEKPTFDSFSVSVERDGSCSMIGIIDGKPTSPSRNAIYELYNDLATARVKK